MKLRCFVLSLLWLVALAGTAAAQMAGAVGIPMADGSLPNATVTVRVVDGSMANVIGIPVSLISAGEERETKTDAQGRATFGGLRAGATAQAVIAGADGAGEISSQLFAIPAQGGMRILLSTQPKAAASNVAPAAASAAAPTSAPSAPFMGAGGDGGAMPDPRQMNGQARAMEGEPGGSLTIRVLQGSLSEPVSGVAVSLVGYGADGKIGFFSGVSDAQGQVRFSDLNRTGHIAYYAFAVLQRGQTLDRVAGGPVILGPQFGARMILSGGKNDGSVPAIDDTLWLASQPPPVPEAGAVVVTVRGEGAASVALIDAKTGSELAQQATTMAGDGEAKATFANVPVGAVYYAQVAADGGGFYRSAPFVTVASRGIGVEILATSPMRFRFHVVAAGIEDAQVGLQGEFAFYNLGWAPLALGIDGFVLKTPLGSRGNLLMEGEENSSIATPTGEGFALRRPLPPMLTSFQGGFSLPHKHGVMKLVWPLPYGAVDSSFLAVDLGGANLDVPPGTRIDSRTAQDGTKLKVINGIQIMPGQSMVLSLRGLPIAPVWRTWLPTAAGLVVLAMLIGGCIIAYRGARRSAGDATPSSQTAREAEIAALYDRLAALPAGDAHAGAREAMISELTALLAPQAAPDIQLGSEVAPDRNAAADDV